MRGVAGGRARLDGAGEGEGVEGGADPGVGLALGGGRGSASFCFAFAFVAGVGGAGPGVAVLLPAVLGLEIADSARALAFFLAFSSALSGWAEAEGREDESP